MRLPQSVIRSLSVYFSALLSTCLTLLLVVMAPVRAGASVPQLTCSPSSLRFGGLDLGQTETLLVTVTNTGATTVTLTEVSVSDSAFRISALSLPLALTAGQSVDVNVSFAPTATGWAGGTVKFFSNASNPTLAVELEGTGVNSESVTASPSILSFGEVPLGDNASLPVVLTNARSRKVTISGVQSTGSAFSMIGPSFPLTLGAGQSVTLSVTFAPQLAGAAGGSLFVYGPALNVPLNGTGSGTQYSVNLFWNSSLDVVGYNVYRSSSASGVYSKINSSLEANTAYTDNTVVGGNTYYYAATSVNSSGQESPKSSPPVEAAIP